VSITDVEWQLEAEDLARSKRMMNPVLASDLHAAEFGENDPGHDDRHCRHANHYRCDEIS